MATRHIPGLRHPRPAATPSAHGRICFSSGRSSPSASVQACCVSTDASTTGWGAMCNGHAAAGLWTGPQLQWHINFLKLLAVWLALCHFKTLLHKRHVLVRTDNTVTVAYINHQAPVACRNSPPSSPLESEASEVALRRLCTRQAQSCSRRALTSARPSRRMATHTVPLPAVLLPVRGDPRHERAGTQLASGPTQICVFPSELSRTDPVQGQGGRGASPFGGALLAQLYLVPRTDAARDSHSLANSSEEGSPSQRGGHPLAPTSRLVESPRVVPGWDAEVLGGLPPAVVNTITSARAPSTRHSYRRKWNLFDDWCSPRREDPRRCLIAVGLSLLQDGLERRLSPSILKVYVASIAAHHDVVDGKSVPRIRAQNSDRVTLTLS